MKMSTLKTKLLLLTAAIILVVACGPTILAPAATADPNEINTLIVQTANSAFTQTAAAQPTLTPTVTVTPTRPTDTPVPTATVQFILFTPTQQVVPTFTFIPIIGISSATSTGSAAYSCQILSVDPANGTSMNTRTDFDTTWKVKNTGQRTWDPNSVDFIYYSGAEIHKKAGYDLGSSVKTGQTINLGVDMVAPKKSGNYTTTWTLRVGNDNFCKMSLTINVR